MRISTQRPAAASSSTGAEGGPSGALPEVPGEASSPFLWRVSRVSAPRARCPSRACVAACHQRRDGEGVMFHAMRRYLEAWEAEGALELRVGWDTSNRWTMSSGGGAFMVCKGYPRSSDVPQEWQQQTSFTTLGHRVDNACGISTCFEQTMSAMQRSYFGNLKKASCTRAKQPSFKFLHSCVQTIAGFR